MRKEHGLDGQVGDSAQGSGLLRGVGEPRDEAEAFRRRQKDGPRGRQLVVRGYGPLRRGSILGDGLSRPAHAFARRGRLRHDGQGDDDGPDVSASEDTLVLVVRVVRVEMGPRPAGDLGGCFLGGSGRARVERFERQELVAQHGRLVMPVSSVPLARSKRKRERGR
ncbi:uncharacterized protein UV8b_04779 [Ustilaginoidea virens]|uniref:Uncharacterized protein n=1 Tax=Ustilaginoidea virens TaxID=1159556 RepID=A0A8E5MHH6_USTVR|nr:uncharacterized protein UV8b_04779 [Ustilaginoidea virens]QUC20538.1 hypothetical protein UV8b_04779 [Ustilaginoidea virens]